MQRLISKDLRRTLAFFTVGGSILSTPFICNKIALAESDESRSSIKWQRIPVPTSTIIPSSGKEDVKKLYPEDLELKQVQIVFRHGDRSPILKWNPLDPKVNAAANETTTEKNAKDAELREILSWICDDDDDEPEIVQHPHHSTSNKIKECHPGQLTRKGKHEQQSIGAALRKIYVDQLGFLSPRINPEEVTLRSTDVPRTRQSLQNMLTGLYPDDRTTKHPFSQEGVKQYGSYAGIPFDVRDHRSDSLYADHQCERLQELVHEYHELEKSKKFKEEFINPLKEELKYFTTQKDERTGRQRNLTEIFDFATCTAHHNKPLFHGLNNETLLKLEKASVFHWWNPSAELKEYARLAIGPLVGELTDVIEQKVKQDKGPKMAFYSGHDSTVGPLLGALNLSDGRWPPYASNVRFEVLQQKKPSENGKPTISNNVNEHYVRIIYNDKVMSLPGCQKAAKGEKGEFCPYDEFVRVAKEVTPKNFKEECKPTTGNRRIAWEH